MIAGMTVRELQVNLKQINPLQAVKPVARVYPILQAILLLSVL
jgi:hypothetical protein